MNPNKIEMWLSIPNTDHRFEVSNFGHVRRMARKTRRGRSTICVLDVKPMTLVADFATGDLGWRLFFDGAAKFFARDTLLALFPSAVINIDRSMDDDTLRIRESALKDYEARYGHPYRPKGESAPCE